jgi:hypothetical protein
VYDESVLNRYRVLVSKKFSVGLTEAEEAEMQRLDDEMNDSPEEAAFYAPGMKLLEEAMKSNAPS